LGELVGVQRAQISKLENGKSIITLGTLLKVMNALKAKVIFEQFSLSFIRQIALMVS
jgi:transcriptional regulator with XRE-family HTH domain